MKACIFVAVLLLFCFGCTPQQSDQLTDQQKDQIKRDLKVVSDSMVATWNRLDIETAIQYYANSPDWVCFSANGSRSDYQGLKKMWTDGANSVTSYKWTTTRQDFIFITKYIVICAWEANAEMIIRKSGDKEKDAIAYTAVFKKIAGLWKVVYCHESGTSVTEKAGAK